MKFLGPGIRIGDRDLLPDGGWRGEIAWCRVGLEILNRSNSTPKLWD